MLIDNNSQMVEGQEENVGCVIVYKTVKYEPTHCKFESHKDGLGAEKKSACCEMCIDQVPPGGY